MNIQYFIFTELYSERGTLYTGNFLPGYFQNTGYTEVDKAWQKVEM